MKKEEFYDEIITALGGNMMDVELCEKDIELTFKKAKRTFQQKGHNSYRKMYYRLKVDPCQTVYSLPIDLSMVVKIIKPDNIFGTGDEFALATFNDLFWRTNRTGATVSEWLAYDFTMQIIETHRRYIVFDVSFHFDEMNKTIRLESPPKRNEYWLVECYLNLSDDEYRDILWIQNWALAEAKIMLGNAYRKFSQLPGPDGTISLDGNGLIQEGTQEKERLLEEIQQGTDGALDYYPVTIG